MKKPILLFLAMMCAGTLISSQGTAARADWGGTPVISQPPMPQPLPNDYLQPTLKDIPSAPQVVTGTGQGNSDAGQESDNSGGGTAHEGDQDPVTQPATQPSGSEIQQEPAAVDTSTLPLPGTSSSKKPWFLAAAVVACAFFLGRRSR